jgi:uncharacterized small protein (DUF1192 family)
MSRHIFNQTIKALLELLSVSIVETFINSLKSEIDTIKENNKQQLKIDEFIKNNSVLNLKL